MSKKLAAFDYIGKILIILCATSSSISIVSFATVIGTSGGIASASFSLAFSVAIGIIKKLLKIARNKK